MSTLAAIQNTIRIGGANPTDLAAAVAAVPVPIDWMTFLGVFVSTDTTVTTATTVSRTVKFRLTPTIAATATVNLRAGSPVDSVVESFTIGATGRQYILPPDVVLSGGGPQVLRQAVGRALMLVDITSIVAQGTAYNPPTTTIGFVGGLAPALLLNAQAGRNISQKSVSPVPNGPPYCVQQVSIVKPGRGYSLATQVQFVGERPQDDPNIGPGFPAQATITAFGPNGEILGVQVTQPGFNYKAVPKIAFFDPNGTPAQTGNEATAVALMGAGRAAQATLTINGLGHITAVHMTDGGDGYVGVSSAVFFDSSGAGSGASATPIMGVSRIDVLDPGQGYLVASPPTVTLVPHFKTMYPDTSDQRGPFWNLMKIAISQATAASVVASPPTLS